MHQAWCWLLAIQMKKMGPCPIPVSEKKEVQEVGGGNGRLK